MFSPDVLTALACLRDILFSLPLVCKRLPSHHTRLLGAAADDRCVACTVAEEGGEDAYRSSSRLCHTATGERLCLCVSVLGVGGPIGVYLK